MGIDLRSRGTERGAEERAERLGAAWSPRRWSSTAWGCRILEEGVVVAELGTMGLRGEIAELGCRGGIGMLRNWGYRGCVGM